MSSARPSASSVRRGLPLVFGDIDLPGLLGRPFDRDAVDLLVDRGIDACGEAGEFHTVVTGGPLFSKTLPLCFGRPILRDGYWFVDVEVE